MERYTSERFSISFEEYQEALINAHDEAYRNHLEQDFIITNDGRVCARLTIERVRDREYYLRDNRKLFSSLPDRS